MTRSAIGPNTGISNGDFVISATSPASMSVVIGPGSIYAPETVDANAFGVLGTDSNTIMKQGISYSPVTLTLTAPPTSGYSQYYLVQVGFAEQDGAAIVPPFLNSANPSVPWNGANNNGQPLNTVRYDQAVISLVAGAAAPTGSQVIPSPSAGSTPLYVILVSNSTTSIVAADWFTSPNAPFFPYLEQLDSLFLPYIPRTTFYVNGGTGNDGNPGTAQLPFRTLQGCVGYLSRYQSETTVTVNVAAGTYAGVGIGATQIANIAFVGSGVTTCFISQLSVGTSNGCGFLFYNGSYSVTGFNISSIDYGIIASSGATVSCWNCSFGNNTSAAIGANSGGSMFAYGGAAGTTSTFTFTGTMGAAFAASTGSWVIVANTSVDYVDEYFVDLAYNSPTFNIANAYSNTYGTMSISASLITISGSATGSRYYANGGTIITGGSGATYLPGTSAGSVVNYGVYE